MMIGDEARLDEARLDEAHLDEAHLDEARLDEARLGLMIEGHSTTIAEGTQSHIMVGGALTIDTADNLSLGMTIEGQMIGTADPGMTTEGQMIGDRHHALMTGD